MFWKNHYKTKTIAYPLYVFLIVGFHSICKEEITRILNSTCSVISTLHLSPNTYNTQQLATLKRDILQGGASADFSQVFVTQQILLITQRADIPSQQMNISSDKSVPCLP